ncbi:WXG100 family type VII secretion target [Amycolatopsis marina]|uniref:WXG100 family type VII secretion target n=1 Tax=Amycolatopsis marina TaxID=490629 RepID=UPI000B84565F|nr:WXG100 family type VII secretion target [Amycolatopsis marina]
MGAPVGERRGQNPVDSDSGAEPAVSSAATKMLDGVRDGDDIATAIADHLSYLEDLCDLLGTTDIVANSFTPLLGRWTELEAEAGRWREVAGTVATASQEADAPLGRLDGAWEGEDADAFVAYIRRVVAAGGEVQDAIGVLASALEETATGVRQVALDMAEVLVDTAETVSESAAMATDGENRARSQLEEARRHIDALSSAASDVLHDFMRLCAAIGDDENGGSQSREAQLARRYPDERFRFADVAADASSSQDVTRSNEQAEGVSVGGTTNGEPVESGGVGGGSSSGDGAAAAQPVGVGDREPERPAGEAQRQSGSAGAAEFGAGALTGAAAGAVAGGAARAAAAPMMGGMMPMGAMGGASGQGGDKEHRTKQRVVTEPNELFGRPEQVAPPVIGEEKPK